MDNQSLVDNQLFPYFSLTGVYLSCLSYNSSQAMLRQVEPWRLDNCIEMPSNMAIHHFFSFFDTYSILCFFYLTKYLQEVEHGRLEGSIALPIWPPIIFSLSFFLIDTMKYPMFFRPLNTFKCGCSCKVY